MLEYCLAVGLGRRGAIILFVDGAVWVLVARIIMCLAVYCLEPMPIMHESLQGGVSRSLVSGSRVGVCAGD